MSTFPKLNIDISDLSKPRRMKFVDIEPEPPPPKPKKNIKNIMLGIAGVIIILMIIFSLNTSNRSLRPRRIIRLNCFTAENTQTCTTSYDTGEFVVASCDAYEFNGIPSIELTKVGENYRIPVSSDLTLRIRDPCPNIIATLDTQRLIPYYKEYARIGKLYTKRLIWITSNCYTSFTLIIGNEKIFDFTPVEMIDSIKLNNRTAYKYESPGVSGSIQITGEGCEYPIHIYSI